MTRQEENGEKTFKNPRNAAAGSLRQKDPSVTKGRDLDIFVFNLQLVEGEKVTSHAQSLELMKELGFHIIPFYRQVTSIEEVIEEVRRIGEQRGNLSYDIDGAVVKVDDFDQEAAAGQHRPNFRNGPPPTNIRRRKSTPICCRWRSTWGRTGVLTPTGVFEPVTLAGDHCQPLRPAQ